MICTFCGVDVEALSAHLAALHRDEVPPLRAKRAPLMSKHLNHNRRPTDPDPTPREKRTRRRVPPSPPWTVRSRNGTWVLYENGTGGLALGDTEVWFLVPGGERDWWLAEFGVSLTRLPPAHLTPRWNGAR